MQDYIGYEVTRGDLKGQILVGYSGYIGMEIYTALGLKYYITKEDEYLEELFFNAIRYLNFLDLKTNKEIRVRFTCKSFAEMVRKYGLHKLVYTKKDIDLYIIKKKLSGNETRFWDLDYFRENTDFILEQNDYKKYYNINVQSMLEAWKWSKRPDGVYVQKTDKKYRYRTDLELYHTKWYPLPMAPEKEELLRYLSCRTV